MKTLKKISKVTSIVCIFLFVSFFIYANLEKPPLHAEAKPISMTILKVSNLESSEKILSEKLSKTKGITAFAINNSTQIVSITFLPELINLKDLVRSLEKESLKVSAAEFGEIDPNTPQCPIPMGYIQQFEKLKYALCIR